MAEARGETPQTIGRYEVVEAVGFGAMGAVYRAFDPLIKREVAVKTLRVDVPPQSPDYQDFLDRFATEAKISGKLSHPNIVTLFDIGRTDDDVPWLAMEFVDGETVAELLEGEKLRAELVVGIISQIASAIDYAHGEGVIHRDIKPSNVIIHGGEKVKVTDFGIAKLMDSEMTQTGVMMGTPSYMSPEQAMGENLDGRTDIFSLGVVAFEMLSGQQPFPGNNVTSILYKLVHADPVRPPDLEVLGLLPDKWHEVFSRVLSKDPDERYPTGAAFVQDLELCLGSWFGSLEGETVVMSAESALADLDGEVAGAGSLETGSYAFDADGDQDETIVLSAGIETAETPGGGDETMVAEPSPLDDSATVMMAPSSRLADAGTEITLPPPGEVESTNPHGQAVNELGSPEETVTLAGGEETVFETSGSEAEETLYAGPGPEEPPPLPDAASPAKAEGARQATVDALSRMAVKLRLPAGLDPKIFGASLVGLIAIIAILALVFAGGPAAPVPEPAPVVSEAPPPPPPVVVATGSLAITSKPEGAEVLVNGEQRGTTPLELDELELGSYQLSIRHPGHQDEEASAELTPEAPRASFDVTLKPVRRRAADGYLRIKSTPDEVTVHVDGKLVGNTPIERFAVRPGKRVVRLTQEGYIPWEDAVQVGAGSTKAVDAIMTARPTAKAPEPVPTPDPPVAPIRRVEEGTLVSEDELDVVSAKCINCPSARFPDEAKRSKMQGLVEVSYLVTERGTVEEIEIVLSGGPLFDASVRQAISEWEFEPATKNGVKVRVRRTQRFRFRQGR